MSHILDQIGAGWVGTVLGLLGILLAIYFYWRSKQVVRIAYEIKEGTVVGPAGGWDDYIKVLYHDQVVPRVTASNVMIWNCGNVTVRKSDVLVSDPPLLTLSGKGQILRALVAKTTRDVIGAKAETQDGTEPDSVTLSFDFLGPRDGFFVTVLHTADVRAIDIRGTIIGLHDGFRRVQGRRLDTEGFIPMLLGMIMATVGILFAAPQLLPNFRNDEMILSFVVCLVILRFISSMGYERVGWRRPPNALVK